MRATASRRAVLSGALLLGGAWASTNLAGNAASGSGATRVAVENRRRGAGPRLAVGHLPASVDGAGHVHGYPSSPGVAAGERLAFHVSAGADFDIAIHRLGHYGGAGSRWMAASPRLRARPQPAPLADAAGTVRCSWEPSWELEIPRSWTSGLYLATFLCTDGRRSHAPFVVRDDGRGSDFLVVLPVTTYQAYNLYPMDGGLGRSLYYGFLPSADHPAAHALSPDGRAYTPRPVTGARHVLHYPARARAVSFDRPYSGSGLPKSFELDTAFVRWAERQGLDLSYATSLDLHDGRADPSRHRTLVFSGHDEYWSAEMRGSAERAVRRGTNLAFLGANNVYWKARIARELNGHALVTCYKSDPDPGRTTQWRAVRPRGEAAEQRLLGTQYTGIVDGRTAPLVVRDARHWLWRGTGLADGDRLPNLVAVEADGLMPGAPRPAAREHALLSHSPFRYAGRPAVQNTSLYRAPGDAWVFNAGTLGWTTSLTDPRVHRATANLFTRLAT